MCGVHKCVCVCVCVCVDYYRYSFVCVCVFVSLALITMNNVIDESDFGKYFNQKPAIAGTVLTLLLNLIVMIFPFLQVTHHTHNYDNNYVFTATIHTAYCIAGKRALILVNHSPKHFGETSACALRDNATCMHA